MWRMSELKTKEIELVTKVLELDLIMQFSFDGVDNARRRIDGDIIVEVNAKAISKQ